MPYKFPDAALLIFCKAPIPGQVKTRLTPAISAEEAAEIHIALTQRTLRLAIQSNCCPVQLWCSPCTDHPFFKSAATEFDLSLQAQQGSDLGQRMHQAFSTVLSEVKYAILIGCDCPSLTATDLTTALNSLANENDVVLSPAEDGGYVLIGLRQTQPDIFSDIPWGTAEVLTATRSRISNLKLRYHEMAQQWDVDTIDDLTRLNDTSKYLSHPARNTNRQ